MIKQKALTNIEKLDIEFFNYLHAVKVATIDQINDNVYEYKTLNGLYKRLRKLEHFRFIRGVAHPEAYPKKIFSLTRYGFNKYVSDGAEERVQLTSDSISHDLELGNIRRRFLNDGIATCYFTENSLNARQNLNTSPELFPYAQIGCDGIAEIPVGKGTIRFAVEYEANAKFWNRYDEILDRYYSNHGIPFVIYISGKGQILSTLKSKDKVLFGDQEPKVFYSSLNQFLYGDTVDLTNRDGKELRIYPPRSRKSDG